MENHHFSWENPLLMAIFNSYVSSPEGIMRLPPSWTSQVDPVAPTLPAARPSEPVPVSREEPAPPAARRRSLRWAMVGCGPVAGDFFLGLVNVPFWKLETNFPTNIPKFFSNRYFYSKYWGYWTSPKQISVGNYIPNTWVMFNWDI